MRRNRYLLSLIGAIIGCATAGGWLIVDLLTPEPIGDFILYPLMAITNIAIGWQVGRALGKRREMGSDDAQISKERDESKFELES
ncbi:hypothetical protein BIV60_07235 [Bacillus sp. MUM 116]|uniref:hypothetical protein n=1 Tax=Bacillus sp. MUM 116 TaxID=1678002 RepID=UPI0008F57363|nr:hypothetical protein [Bacillus sp. MUM 116]OIK15909.1 hypothetical protein BIV60_07235 [Bacillus sp. MUM 116]